MKHHSISDRNDRPVSSRPPTTHLVHLLEDLAEPRRQRIALLGEQGMTRLSALETALGDGEVHPGRAGVDNARDQ